MTDTQQKPGKVPEILTSCRFYLELVLNDSKIPGIDAYFMECKGFKRNFDVIDACEVTPQKWAKASSGLVVRTKIPGNAKTNNIILRRGMTNSTTLWKWFAAVESGKWAEELRDGSLTICDQAGQAQAIFQFRGAFPISYIVSDFNAGSNDIEIEEMEMAVEMFERVQ
ncbi:MAG: phage tail protein [Scytonematopsis contorta HA4267-MV1]|jgi:phage tail-like protein|nr:phage tail protein [Scytonematopsis contorta HA4267-MV1]